MPKPTTVNPLTVMTWNVNFRQAFVLEVLTNLHHLPDILTLQEVSVAQVDSYHQRLAEMGFKNLLYSGRVDRVEKRLNRSRRSSSVWVSLTKACLSGRNTKTASGVTLRSAAALRN